MFDLYIKEFKIIEANGNTSVYKLKPLTGKYLSKLYNTIMKLQKNTEGKTEDKLDLSVFDTETISTLHELALETMAASYPKEDRDTLDRFVSQNLMQLIEPIVSVNIPNKK